MSDYSSLLERRAGTLTPPDDSFRRTLDRYHDRQRRRRRNRRAASAALGILMSAAGFVAALRAFGGDSTPARRPLPPPIGVAPPSVGPVRSIQPLTPSRAVALTRHARSAGARESGISRCSFG